MVRQRSLGERLGKKGTNDRQNYMTKKRWTGVAPNWCIYISWVCGEGSWLADEIEAPFEFGGSASPMASSRLASCHFRQKFVSATGEIYDPSESRIDKIPILERYGPAGEKEHVSEHVQ